MIVDALAVISYPPRSEAQGDQQTAAGDERDHVAHTGEQDPLDARTERDLRRRARRRASSAVPLTRAPFGFFAVAIASAISCVGLLDARA